MEEKCTVSEKKDLRQLRELRFETHTPADAGGLVG